MTPHNERRACGEAVRAFRLAVTELKDPAPALFAELLAAPEGLSDLERELPLVYFSPFGTIPNDMAYGRGESLHQYARDSGRTFVTGSETTRSGDGWPGAHLPPDGSKDFSRTASPKAGESAGQPPIFSLRRSSASVIPDEQRQPLQRAQDVPRDLTNKSVVKGDSHVRERAWGDRNREEPAAVEAHPDLAGSAYSETATYGQDTETNQGAEDLASGARHSIYPASLLNSLAEGALEAVKGRTQNVLVRPSNMSPPQPVLSGEPVLRSREPSREASGDSAVASIDSLAERLLVPEAQIYSTSPSQAPGAGDVEEADLAHTPFALLDGVDRQSASRPPSGSNQFGLDQEIAKASPGPYMDAETYAALVNEVLIRQARRHGVDLS